MSAKVISGQGHTGKSGLGGYGFPSLDKEGWRAAPGWFDLVAIGFITLLLAGGAQAAAPVRHELTVTLEPEQHRLAVVDVVTLPEPLGRDQSLQFTLHPDLTVDAAPQRLRCSRPESDSSLPGSMPQTCTLTISKPVATLTLRYSGAIQHALRQQGDDTRGFQETPGFIGAEGVFLAGASQWYPQFGGDLVSFTLEVTLPESWRAVSQGSRRLDTVTGIKRFEDLDEDDYRWQSPRFQGENFQRNLALVAHIEGLAAEKGCTPAQLALAWVLAQGEDIVPIPQPQGAGD